MTMKLTQQQLDKIVDEISRADVEWDTDTTCHSYTKHNIDGVVNVGIYSAFRGHPEDSSIIFEGRRYAQPADYYVDSFDEAELCETWEDASVDYDIDVDIDMDYINQKLIKLYN